VTAGCGAELERKGRKERKETQPRARRTAARTFALFAISAFRSDLANAGLLR
jgi:hypothetical protein